MMYLQRLLEAKLTQLAQFFPVVVVSGARQVGKTTLLQHLFAGAKLVTFDPTVDILGARRDPDLFLAHQPRPLILDEIQYAPELTAAIKRAVDRDRQPGQFLLTGSQQWQVMRTVGDSLAGRAVFCDLQGFSLGELSGHPEPWLPAWLEHGKLPAARLALPHPAVAQCWRGFMPEAQRLPEALIADFYDAYLRTYIERDARHLGGASDWQEFSRFARLTFALTGREVQVAQLGRGLGVHGDTAKRWLSTLAATFQWIEVPPWHGNAVKRLSRHPKGFAQDTGLACRVLGIASPDALLAHPQAGALFETAVASELSKQSAAMATKPLFYHWRSHGGAEVDLVLAYGGKLYPIEVKLNSQPTRREARGIEAFRATYPSDVAGQGLILAPVQEAYPLGGGITVCPWDACGASAG